MPRALLNSYRYFTNKFWNNFPKNRKVVILQISRASGYVKELLKPIFLTLEAGEKFIPIESRKHEIDFWECHFSSPNPEQRKIGKRCVPKNQSLNQAWTGTSTICRVPPTPSQRLWSFLLTHKKWYGHGWSDKLQSTVPYRNSKVWIIWVEFW